MRLNGEIRLRDATVGVVRDGLLTRWDAARLPLYLLRTKDLEAWLRSRAIDAHRTNSRLLKRALRIASGDDMEAVLRVHAATITDAYWFCAAGEALTFADVQFRENQFAALALRGDPDGFNQPYSHTPELTNIGSYEKCWQLRGGRWWMVKQGNDLERFSELFICRLGQALGFPMAEYYAENTTVASPDFTGFAAVNFESADGIMGDDEDYGRNFDAFFAISPDIARAYLQIIYLDALCFNMDRHTKNYGVLRDADTGAVLSMAPNFDNNIALFSRGIPQNLSRTNDKLLALFCELLAQDARAFALAKALPIPAKGQIEACALATGIPVAMDALCAFICNGSAQVQRQITVSISN
ncbi:MAG: hypothetical protein LBS96_07590 [Oscillospiraceae bacterium]|jgi:hypothetical protein|nr:hypothetical protein [Oscillospiraceae bacterium]